MSTERPNDAELMPKTHGEVHWFLMGWHWCILTAVENGYITESQVRFLTDQVVRLAAEATVHVRTMEGK